MFKLQNIYKHILNLFFPPKCINCGIAGYWICHKCFDSIDIINTPICYGCGKLSDEFKVCSKCRGSFPLKRVIVCAHWQNPLKVFVYNLKYHKLHVLAEKLGALMAVTYFKFSSDKDVIITPVPLHRNRIWARGFNQADILAREIAKLLGVNFANLLIRSKNTKPQFGLSRNLRRQNVDGIFRFNLKKTAIIKNKTIVLIDDVIATGSTLKECAKVLKNNGAKEIWALVLARA